MTFEQVGEHHIGAGALAGIERLYRCPNGYGAIVYHEPPGSAWADRLLVTPVRFAGEGDAYQLLSSEEASEGASDDPIRPAFVFSQAEVEALLQRLSKLSEEEER